MDNKHTEFWASLRFGADTADLKTHTELTVAIMARRVVLTVSQTGGQPDNHGRTILLTAQAALTVANTLNHLLALAALHSSKSVTFTATLEASEGDLWGKLHLSLLETGVRVAITNEKDCPTAEKFGVVLPSPETVALMNTLRLYAEMIDTETGAEVVAEEAA